MGGETPQTLLWQHKFQPPPLLKSTLQTKMGGDNTKDLGNTVSWVDSLKHLTSLIGNIVPNSCTQNCQQQPKKTKVGLLIIETTRKFNVCYVFSCAYYDCPELFPIRISYLSSSYEVLSSEVILVY